MKIKEFFINKNINIKRLVVVLIILLLVVAVVALNPDLRESLFNDTPIKLNFQSGVEYSAVAYENDMLLVSKEGIRAVNEKGETSWDIVFAMIRPMTFIKDEYITVADIGGTAVNVYKKDKAVTQIKMDKEIVVAKPDRNGGVAVVTEELGYKGVVTAFDKDGKEYFKWHSGSGYIGDVALSSGELAVAQLMTDGTGIYTRVMLIDTEKKDDSRCIGEIAGIAMTMDFNDNGDLMVVSDAGLYCYDGGGKQKFCMDFEGRTPVSCNVENEDNMVFIFDGDLNNSVIESYSEDGKLRGRYESNGEVKAFDVSGEYILFSTVGTVTRISPSGELESEIPVSGDVKKMKIFSNRNWFVSMGGSSAEIIGIK